MSDRKLSCRAGAASLPIPAEWKQAAREALRHSGHNQAWLAEQLGCSRTAVTDLLNSEDRDTSTLRARADELLGLPAFSAITKRKPSMTSHYFGSDAVSLADIERMAVALELRWDDVLADAGLPKASLSRARHGAAGVKTTDRLLAAIQKCAREAGISDDRIAGAALNSMSMDSTAPRGPKEGPAWPTPEDWKHAVNAALDERGWNQSDLAREVSKHAESTPAAISYVLTKGKQSALRPFIDKVLGLAPHEATFPIADTSLLAELLNVWASLSTANRGRLVERANALVETQS